MHEDYSPLLHEGRSSSSGFSRVIWGRQPLIMSDMCSFLHICCTSWNMEFLNMFQEQGSTPLLHNSHLVEITGKPRHKHTGCYTAHCDRHGCNWNWSFLAYQKLCLIVYFAFWHFNFVLLSCQEERPTNHAGQIQSPTCVSRPKSANPIIVKHTMSNNSFPPTYILWFSAKICYSLFCMSQENKQNHMES